MIDFSKEYKERVFDKIAKEYFDKNFGSMNKTDLETLLFSEYIEYLIHNGEPFDDYTLSKQLGITQSRIRGLKERKELKYPIEEGYWKNSFAKSVENAKYDKENNRIIIPIEDVNVLIEVRHYIEGMGWYDEYKLNRKLLTITIECFIELCDRIDEDFPIFSKEAKKTIDKLAKKDGISSEVVDFAKDFTKEGLKRFLINASMETIRYCMELLSFNGTGGMMLKNLLHIICEG